VLVEEKDGLGGGGGGGRLAHGKGGEGEGKESGEENFSLFFVGWDFFSCSLSFFINMLRLLSCLAMPSSLSPACWGIT